MATTADETKTTSLARRAPVELIPSRSWHLLIILVPGLAILTYDATLEQKNPCIRSQLGSSSLRVGRKARSPIPNGPNTETTAEDETVISFPYPNAFRKVLESHPQRRVLTTTNNSGFNFFFMVLTADIVFSYRAETCPIPDEENRGRSSTDNSLFRHEPSAQTENGPREIVQHRWGISSSGFEFTRTSAIEREIQIQPTYVILGIFSRGLHHPQERAVFVSNPTMLLWKLRWGIFRLRGLSSTFLSLRQVKSFRLYKCNHKEGTHERIHLDKNGAADLQVFLHMYKSWSVPSHIALAWANWIHQTLNNNSLDVVDGSYAIEVVLDWSPTRISIVILFPVLLSLAIGLWLNSVAWTDLATIQTAWGTASYVVTAGGLLAALLVLSAALQMNSRIRGRKC